MTGSRRLRAALEPGFTLIEMLVASVITTIVVIGALSIYVRSNKTAADQQQYTQVQQDVRAAMQYVSRGLRMAGTGLTEDFRALSLEGTDNESQGGAVLPDRIKIVGNMDIPFIETIESTDGSVNKVDLSDYSLKQYPYLDADYVGKIILVLPKPGSTCTNMALCQITKVKQKSDGTDVSISFTHGQAKNFNPPGGLKDVCANTEYPGGTILFADIHEFWLDVTGNASGLTAGQNGYIGGGTGGVLYMTVNGVHCAVAQNIENLQFQYNGDLDADGALDGFQNWTASWTTAQRGRIREVRVWVLGRTPDRFVGIPSLPARNTYLYRRPLIANSAAATSDDGHKRFLLDSSANIRNMSLDIYNKDQR